MVGVREGVNDAVDVGESVFVDVGLSVTEIVFVEEIVRVVV